MTKDIKLVEHEHTANLTKLFACSNRTNLKTILICGLTATLWVRFLNEAFKKLLPHVNVQFIATDRFPANSEFITEAFYTYGLPFRPERWYEQFDLKDGFPKFASAVKNGCIWIQGEWVEVDGVMCTTTPDLNLAVLELWLAQGVQVYLDKPLVKFTEYELRRVKELKRQYPHLLIVGDFFISSPVVNWALGNLQQLVPGAQLAKVFGACKEPWGLKGEQTASGNRSWMPNPDICEGVGGNDCGVHVLSMAAYFLSQLGFPLAGAKAIGLPICGRYLEGGKTDFVVETGFFGEYSVGDVPVFVHAGKGLAGEPLYGMALRFDTAQVGIMVGTKRFDPHVSVDDGRSVTVHKITNGGLGYVEIAADFLTVLYGNERLVRQHQARVFAAMHSASAAISDSYVAFKAANGTFADYPIGGLLPGVPNWALLDMPQGLLPDRDIPTAF